MPYLAMLNSLQKFLYIRLEMRMTSKIHWKLSCPKSDTSLANARRSV